MKTIFEKIKDILYDSFDYVIMAVIVIAVISVIGWRLDVLFANDALDIDNKDKEVIVDNSSREPNKKPDKIVHNPEEEEETEDEESPDTGAEEEEDIQIPEPPADEPVVAGPDVHINIPAGSLPGTIARILQENGLIHNSKDFIAKAVELKLDTKMKSGNYTIAKGNSIEQILQIITK